MLQHDSYLAKIYLYVLELCLAYINTDDKCNKLTLVQNRC